MEILPIAVKFVSWDVSPLDTLKNSRAYMLREKLNGNGKMDRTEKNWLAENIKNNSYFRTSIPLMGYRFDLQMFSANTLSISTGNGVSTMPPIKQAFAMRFTVQLTK